jgi:hypothetical protein
VPPLNDVTVYIVVEDFGDLGRSFRETDLAEADLDTIVRNMIRGSRSQEKKSRLARRLRWWTSSFTGYGVLAAFRDASLASPAASCAAPLALSNLPSA